MATTKQLLKEKAALGKRRSDIIQKVRKEHTAATNSIDKQYEPVLADIKKREDQLLTDLAKTNPYQVGDHLSYIMLDGMIGGNVYQVTRVVDHEYFYARLITARGKLGATVDRFRFQRGSDAKFRKVPPPKSVRK